MKKSTKKRAAPAPAAREDVEDVSKRLKATLDGWEREQHARVAAFFARMPAVIAAMPPAAADLVVYQLRAELVQPGVAPEKRVFREVLLQGSATLFMLAKTLGAVFSWTPPPQFEFKPVAGSVPKNFAWCATSAGKAVPELRTAAAQKAVSIASIWAKALTTAVRYCSHGGHAYKVWCIGGAPRQKLRGGCYEPLPRCVGGLGVAPTDCGLQASDDWPYHLPFMSTNIVDGVTWGECWEDLYELNMYLRGSRQGPTGFFSDDTSQAEVEEILNRGLAEPPFLVAVDGTVHANVKCIELRDVRTGMVTLP